MLEEERIWAYAVGGGVTVTFPRASRLSQSHLAPIAQTKIAAGHMWVCVPPFRVVDITLPIQGWSAAKEAYFEGFVIQESSMAATPTVYEILDVDLIAEFQLLNGRLPQMKDIETMAAHIFPMMERFPAFQVKQWRLLVKYVPVNFRASDEHLKDLEVPILNGKRPEEIYQQSRV